MKVFFVACFIFALIIVNTQPGQADSSCTSDSKNHNGEHKRHGGKNHGGGNNGHGSDPGNEGHNGGGSGNHTTGNNSTSKPCGSGGSSGLISILSLVLGLVQQLLTLLLGGMRNK